MDLARPAKTRVEAQYEHWPKCYRCSVELDRPYPVERYKVLGREPSRRADGKYDLILDVACTHGEARRVRLERESQLVQRLWGMAGGLVGGVFPASSEQRVRLEIPNRWAGLELPDGSYQQGATEIAAIGRVYCFAPGLLGRHGVVFVQPKGRARLETTVR